MVEETLDSVPATDRSNASALSAEEIRISIGDEGHPQINTMS